MTCPYCKSTDVTYDMFSGINSSYCWTCQRRFPLDHDPRAVLFQKPGFRKLLFAEMDESHPRLPGQRGSTE